MRLLVASPILLFGCNAVLGLDERGRASTDGGEEDAASTDTSVAIDSAVIVEETGDNETGNDTSLDTGTIETAIVPPIDTGTVDTGGTTTACGAAVCSDGRRCYIRWNATSDTYSRGCADPPPTSTSLGSCSLAGAEYICSDGFACGYLYPGSKVCFPLCSGGATTDACPSQAPYCNVRVDDTLSRCGQCSPLGKTTDCPLMLLKCMVNGTMTAPTCSKYGVHGQGGSCRNSQECAPGFVCECGLSALPRLGNDCVDMPSAVCRQLCNTANPCAGAGLSCVAVGGTGYSVCR